MPQFAMPVGEADPRALAKEKLASGHSLTSEEARLVASVPMSEARLNRGMGPAETPKKPAMQGGQATPEQLGAGAARMAGIVPAQTQVTPFGKVNAGLARAATQGGPLPPIKMPEEPVDAITGASPMPKLGKITAPVAVAPKAIPPINAKGPEPVVSSAFKAAAESTGDPAIAQATEEKMNTPVAPDDASKALTAFQQFLAKNPNGVTLANILDAVGVSLSAYGGTQRKTMLQSQKEAEMALAGQQTVQQAGFGQQDKIQQKEFAQQMALKKQELDNQTVILQKEYQNAIAQGNNLAALQIQNRLKEIEAQKNANIEQERAVRGVGYNLPSAVNKYSGAPQ